MAQPTSNKPSSSQDLAGVAAIASAMRKTTPSTGKVGGGTTKIMLVAFAQNTASKIARKSLPPHLIAPFVELEKLAAETQNALKSADTGSSAINRMEGDNLAKIDKIKSNLAQKTTLSKEIGDLKPAITEVDKAKALVNEEFDTCKLEKDKLILRVLQSANPSQHDVKEFASFIAKMGAIADQVDKVRRKQEALKIELGSIQRKVNVTTATSTSDTPKPN